MDEIGHRRLSVHRPLVVSHPVDVTGAVMLRVRRLAPVRHHELGDILPEYLFGPHNVRCADGRVAADNALDQGRIQAFPRDHQRVAHDVSEFCALDFSLGERRLARVGVGAGSDTALQGCPQAEGGSSRRLSSRPQRRERVLRTTSWRFPRQSSSLRHTSPQCGPVHRHLRRVHELSAFVSCSDLFKNSMNSLSALEYLLG